MENNSKNVLITGCAGFIGSHATDLFLEKEYNVTGLDSLTYAGDLNNLKNAFKNKNFKFYQEDICNQKEIQTICENRKINWIINFAAETHVDNSIKDSDSFIKSNILGVKSLLEVCKRSNIKILHISTDEVYGSTKSGMFFEHSLLNPTNPYSATKAAAEHYVRSYGNTFNVEYMIVRPTNNIGKRQHSEKFFPTILKCIKEGRKIPIYGSGRQVREWLFVKDNVKAIEFILKNSNINQTYNIGSSNEITNIEFVEKICKILKIDINEVVEYVKDRPGHDFRYSVSNEKLNMLGFRDYNTIDQILEEMLTEDD